MPTKYVITFSNCTENGVVAPEKLCHQSILEYVTQIIADAAKVENYNLDNCTAYQVNGMYKGNSESSFRLEYITSIPAEYLVGFALWIKHTYKQESVLMETYSNDGYKAELLYGLGETVEL